MKKITYLTVLLISLSLVSACQNTNMQQDSSSINPGSTNADAELEISHAIVHTSKGDIKLEFFGNDSPQTVRNFINLAKSGFYDGTRFHRVIADFMIQGGDPLTKDVKNKNIWGTGGPSYRFADEINNHRLVKGSVAMANSGPNTNGSQFFIVTAEQTAWLDGKHTNFARVVSGMDVVMSIQDLPVDQNDVPLEDVFINNITLE